MAPRRSRFFHGHVRCTAEFAEEIIGPMDFYRAGQADPTIQTFTDELRAVLRRID
jgi:hypothetical protein